MKKIELSFKDIFRAIRSKILLLLAVTIIAGGAAWVYTHYMVTPIYVATAKMYAVSNTQRQNTTEITTNEQNASRRLVDTCLVVICSDTVLQTVSEQLWEESGIRYSSRALAGMIGGGSINNTEIFYLSVQNANPSTAQAIANTIATVAETKVVEVLGSGSVSVVDLATKPAAPVTPNVNKNVIFGALIGFSLSLLFIIVRDLYDTTIWTEEDVQKQYDIPVLGTIPELQTAENSDEKEHEYETT